MPSSITEERFFNNKQFVDMYAIVEIAGQQFKVEKDQQLFVHRLDAKEGDKVDFDNVMLTEKMEKSMLAPPLLVEQKFPLQ